MAIRYANGENVINEEEIAFLMDVNNLGFESAIEYGGIEYVCATGIVFANDYKITTDEIAKWRKEYEKSGKDCGFVCYAYSKLVQA